MSTVTVIKSEQSHYIRHVSMTLAFENGYTVYVRRSPVDVSFSNIGHTWEETARAGRTGALRHKGIKTPSMQMMFTLGERDPWVSIQGQLNMLIKAAQRRDRCFVVYSPGESGVWQVTNFSYDVLQREPATHEPSRATCDMTFTLLSTQIKTNDLLTQVGASPFDSPNAPSIIPTPPPTPAAQPPTSSAGTRYTVVKGDTLWAIANRFYGNPFLWSRIADANGITNPRRLQIGTILTIP